MVFSRSKRRPAYTNTEIVLSERGQQDSLMAAQVIFNRHKLEKGKPAPSPSTSNINVNDTYIELAQPVPRRNHIRLSKSPPPAPSSTHLLPNIRSVNRVLSPASKPDINKTAEPTIKKVNAVDTGAAQIAAALAHTYITDFERTTVKSREDYQIPKSIKDEVLREALTPSPLDNKQLIRRDPVHNFEVNRRKIENGQHQKRDRLRPPPVMEGRRGSYDDQDPHLGNVEYYNDDDRSIISETQSLQDMPIAHVESNPYYLTKTAEDDQYIDGPGVSIGTSIMPRKKSKNKVKSLKKKIFGKGNDSNLRNHDILVSSSIGNTPLVSTSNLQRTAAPIYNSNTSNGSDTNLTNLNAPMRFKTTMRYDDHKKIFNEDKPWKSHKDVKYLSEQERKRYEGMWVSNRYRYLNLLSWWPTMDGEDNLIENGQEDNESKEEGYLSENEEEKSEMLTNTVSSNSLAYDKSDNDSKEVNKIETGIIPGIKAQSEESEPTVPVISTVRKPSDNDILLNLPDDGLILNLIVRDIWDRSNLSSELLRQIYELVDTRGDGTLDRKSFIVGMWLVDQCLYGRKLPGEVDQQMWDSVDRYVMNVIQAKTDNESKNKNRTKRRIVGKEFKHIKSGIKHVHL